MLDVYKKLSNEIKKQLKATNGAESIKYKTDFIKIRLDLDDDDLPLRKVLSFSVLDIIVKSVFEDENKYYLQIHVHEYENECEY